MSYTNQLKESLKREKLLSVILTIFGVLTWLIYNNLKVTTMDLGIVLNVIDVFSKFVLSVPIKDKTGKTITNTYQSIVKTSNRKPKKLWGDNGSESYNNVFKKWLVQNEIKMYCTFNEGKAAVIE